MTEHKSTNQKGFTLIELIGVLAIMAIMAGMLAPNLVEQVRSARADVEVGNLARLAAGLEAYILANRVIPASAMGDGAGGAADWDDRIMEQVLLPIDQIAKANNGDGCPRRYWFDPNTNLPSLPGNPYIQANVVDANNDGIPEKIPVIYTTAGVLIDNSPKNARAMIISDLSDNCANDIESVNNFQSVWAQTGVLPESGTLKIQRMSFSQLFEPVALLNRSTTQAVRKSDVVNAAAVWTTWQTVMTLPANAQVVALNANAGYSDNMGFFSCFHVQIANQSGGIIFSNPVTGNNTLVSQSNPPLIPWPVPPFTSVPVTWSYPGGVAATQIRMRVMAVTNCGGAGTYVAPLSGYIDITVTYQAPASWKLIDYAPPPPATPTKAPTISIVAGVNPTIYVINGTQLFLCDGAGGVATNCQAETGGVTQLASLFIKESDSFVYSPGPPAIWGR